VPLTRQCRILPALQITLNLVYSVPMRVLVAGRHAKALAIAASAADAARAARAARAAKASDTSGNDLKIETAATKAASIALLERAEFDLVIACETLGDGSGLEVLRHAAVNTPDTLRIFAARPSTLNLLKGELGLFGLFRTLPYPINFRKLWAALNLARSCCVEMGRPVAKPQQAAAVHTVAKPPAGPRPPARIPESEAFRRARAKRNATMLEANSDSGSSHSSRATRQVFEGGNRGRGRQEPAMTKASLAQLAQLATIHRPTYDSRSTTAGKNRTAFFVGSGVFAVATAAVLTFFMLNANVRSPLPLVASVDRPASEKVIPWQETAQPTDPLRFAPSEASPSAADLKVGAEAESENSAIEPGHPAPPPPNPAPPPAEPPSLESLPATPADAE
jgi:hypothetical protein